MNFFKKKKSSPFDQKIKLAKKQVKNLKIKFFLLYTLPVFIISLGQTVWKEYSHIKIRQAASSVDIGEHVQ